MVSLIDIINIEHAIGENILDANNAKNTAIISRVCKLFNEITKKKMDAYYKKYIKNIILKRIDVVITNKMYSIIKNIIKNNGTQESLYKTVEEYDKDLYEISKEINNNIYDDIIDGVKTAYKEYIFDASISNSCYEIYVFGIMESEYLKLIKYLEKNI
jgi:uncharacterized membrane-anchored protein YjiN (DUF445 family)